MKNIFIIVCLLALNACDSFSSKSKETISKTGEVVGKTSSTFIDGVKEGIDQTFACEIILSDELIKEGLKTGKYKVTSEAGANDNKLEVYLIFKNDFNRSLRARLTDGNDVEYGRAKTEVHGKKGEAAFADFIFDKRTQIEGRSKVFIE